MSYKDDLAAIGQALDDDMTELAEEIADLDARVQALEAGTTPTPPNPEPGPDERIRIGLDMRNYGLYIGSDPREPGEATLGPSWIGRTFSDPTESGKVLGKGAAARITDCAQARPYADAGRAIFHSMKPDRTQATNGNATMMAAFDAIAKSMDDGDMFTVYHEPENDMTADQWWAMFGPVYDTMKNARPGLAVVYCAMTYQHGPGGAALGKSDSWCRDAPCDGFGADDYGPHPNSGKNFNVSLDTKTDWQNWYKSASKQAGPGKPRALQVHEFGRSGQDPAAVAARPGVLRNSYDWCAAKGFDLFLYWNSSTGQSGTWWPLDDAGSIDAWRSMVADSRVR